MDVTGFRGKGLMNSFLSGDDANGTSTAPPFLLSGSSSHFGVAGAGRTPLLPRLFSRRLDEPVRGWS